MNNKNIKIKIQFMIINYINSRIVISEKSDILSKRK